MNLYFKTTIVLEGKKDFTSSKWEKSKRTRHPYKLQISHFYKIRHNKDFYITLHLLNICSLESKMHLDNFSTLMRKWMRGLRTGFRQRSKRHAQPRPEWGWLWFLVRYYNFGDQKPSYVSSCSSLCRFFLLSHLDLLPLYLKGVLIMSVILLIAVIVVNIFIECLTFTVNVPRIFHV